MQEHSQSEMNTQRQPPTDLSVDTVGYCKGVTTDFKQETVYTEPEHNALFDKNIPATEWRVKKYEINGKTFITFYNNGKGMSTDEMRMAQLMSNYKGAREGITGKFGEGLAALRGHICGETGQVYWISCQTDITEEYESVDDFMNKMRQGKANGDNKSIQCINYSMANVFNGNTTISFPEDIPFVGMQLWKNNSPYPMKPGTLMAYECCPRHIEFLQEQEQYIDKMSFENHLYNLIFSGESALNAGKKMYYNDRELRKIPSFEDYNNELNDEQNIHIVSNCSIQHQRNSSVYWIKRSDMPGGKIPLHIDKTVTRRNNRIVHKIIKILQEYSTQLNYDLKRPTDKILPYIFQEFPTGKYFLVAKKYQSADGSGIATTHRFGTHMYPINLKNRKTDMKQIIRQMEAGKTYVEYHEATAVYDDEGYRAYITPALAANGLTLDGVTNKELYENHIVRGAVNIRIMGGDVDQTDYGVTGTSGFMRVKNKYKYQPSELGDELNGIKKAKFDVNFASLDKDLMRGREYLEFTKNAKEFNKAVSDVIKQEQHTTKFKMKIEEFTFEGPFLDALGRKRYGIKVGERIKVRMNDTNIEGTLMEVVSTNEKQADVVIRPIGVDDGSNDLVLKWGERGATDTFKKPFTDFKKWHIAYIDSMTGGNLDEGEKLEELDEDSSSSSSSDSEHEEKEDEDEDEDGELEEELVDEADSEDEEEEEEEDGNETDDSQLAQSTGGSHPRASSTVHNSHTREQNVAKLNEIVQKVRNGGLTQEEVEDCLSGSDGIKKIYANIWKKWYCEASLEMMLDLRDTHPRPFESYALCLEKIWTKHWVITDAPRCMGGAEIGRLYAKYITNNN